MMAPAFGTSQAIDMDTAFIRHIKTKGPAPAGPFVLAVEAALLLGVVQHRDVELGAVFLVDLALVDLDTELAGRAAGFADGRIQRHLDAFFVLIRAAMPVSTGALCGSRNGTRLASLAAMPPRLPVFSTSNTS